MVTIDLSRHPISTLWRIVHQINGNPFLHFSFYRYSPQQLVDERRVVRVPAREVTERWLLHTLDSLRPDEDLALNSNVKVGSAEFHIPMIDFAGIGVDHLGSLKRIFGNLVAEEFDFYSSGRSFHAYRRVDLVTHADWVRFMGKLLLCNLQGMPLVVDQRWVGHRLVGGYSALRWSCNSSRYRQYPEFIERIEDFDGLTRNQKLQKLSGDQN